MGNDTAVPRLVAVSGRLQGTVIPLEEKESSIGRDPENLICINEHWISRKHCVIKNDNGQFKIIDLGSHNGTFVNGVPIKEQLLEHEDRIGFAGAMFLFLLHEVETTPVAEVSLAEEASPFGPTVQLRRDDAVYLNPNKLHAAKIPPARVERDLSALLKISNALASEQDVNALQRTILEQIFEIVPAQRGAILLGPGESPEEFATSFGLDESGKQPVRVSRTIVAQAIKEKAAILSNRVEESAKLRGAKSLTGRGIQSVFCLPLIRSERVIGAIYLDSQDPKAEFREDQLELLTAIAGIAAAALENVHRLDDLQSENFRLRDDYDLEHNMVGEGPRLQDVHRFIAKVAATDATVLINGESGTGKELVARALHINSRRARKPLVKIDCATLTENLLESELFGHEKGAFTGATALKKGKLEIANGGTAFLDEIGELPTTLQAKLLRVLQDREFEHVGGTRPIRVDIRLIAATNRDLVEEVKKGTFREDLFHRLNVVAITLPPLRDRREDIPMLASYFTSKYSGKTKRRVTGLSAEATKMLERYSWPGNIRELENAIERAVVLGSTDVILPEDLPEALTETGPPAGTSLTKYHDAVTEKKKELIIGAVKQSGGNYTEAAKFLGLHPNYLHRLIRNLDIKADLKN
ncbi:MAG: sigma 54-interacting transcriptional regulator [Vicinamibacteria bacterium]